MKPRRFSTLRLCNIGIMIAVYYLLAKLTIPIGNLRITLAPLPIVVLAVLYGPLDASVAALLGEFMIQALGKYGLTPTTPLWCLPPVFRALTVGFGFRLINRRFNRGTWQFLTGFYACLMLGAVLTTIGNTAVTWLDSIIYNYYTFAYVFGQLLIRLVTGMLTAIAVGCVVLPIERAVTRLHIRIR